MTEHVAEPLDEESESSAIVFSPGAMGAMVRSEVEAQLAAAHRFPRSIKRFLAEAITLASESVAVAESCIYTLKRREADGTDKLITGPSVRLAEIAASAYGNMRVAARVIDDDEKFITAQGLAWDLEKNNLFQVETRRRITTKKGVRYGDDMIVVTGNAATSIALRNAIFRVISRSYVNRIFEHVRKVAVGDAQTLTKRRKDILDRLAARGASIDRVLAKLGKHGIDDIGLEDLEILIGLGTSLASGEEKLDDIFPVPAPAPAPTDPAEDGKRISLKKEPARETKEQG